MTVYRLYHTHSLGSVEPTIALSESLWSRIVTHKTKKQKNKKKKSKSEKPKISKIFASVFVFVASVFVISNTDDEIELNCLR